MAILSAVDDVLNKLVDVARPNSITGVPASPQLRALYRRAFNKLIKQGKVRKMFDEFDQKILFDRGDRVFDVELINPNKNLGREATISELFPGGPSAR